MPGLARTSIIWRVTFYFAVSTSLLIAAVGGLLYITIDRHLMQERTAVIAVDIESIRDFLERISSYSDFVEHPRIPQRYLLEGSPLHVVIADKNRKLLISSSHLDTGISRLSPVDVGGQVERSELMELPPATYYRAVRAWARVGQTGNDKVLVTVALDVSLEQRLLGRYRETLFIVFLVGVLCAAVFGYDIIRRGLEPLRRIAQSAREITSRQLDRKLELENAPEELRELIIAFNGMLDRLHDSFSRLYQFSSDLAHELRTPINNLMGEAQVALSRTRSAEEYRAVLESSVEEFERLARMVESMLFIARADDAEIKLTPVSMNARGELEKIAEFYQLLAEETGASIKCLGTAYVYADPLLFRRAVTNLLSNALRYSPKGAEIVLDVKSAGNGNTEVSVSNPGPGIPREYLERIFDRFYQVDPSRDKSGEGAGLGLAIVKIIMGLHGGSVSVASIPGEITTFTLKFPQSNINPPDVRPV